MAAFESLQAHIRFGLHGPCGPYPATYCDDNDINSLSGIYLLNLSSAPHLRVVSRKEKGKSSLPGRSKEKAFHVPQGGAAVGVRDAIGRPPRRFVSAGQAYPRSQV
jgi:hypothetical protein